MHRDIIKTGIAFFILILMVNPTSHGSAQKAVIIAIDQYKNFPALAKSVSNAEEFSRILSKNSYECINLFNAEATKAKISDTFIDIEIETNRGAELDTLLVYFSGRGTRMQDDIPADEIQDNLDEFILPSDAVLGELLTYMRDDILTLRLGSIKTNHIVLIIDCGFWGDKSDPGVKGIGELQESDSLDGIEASDGLPKETVILSSGLPDARVVDGVFSAKLVESLNSEDADKNNDRKVSLMESYGYVLERLKDSQKPRIYNTKDFDMMLSSLPQLSSLTIGSKPEGAEVRIFKGSEQIDPDAQLMTPAKISLKTGSYTLKLRKPGFLIPEPKDVEIARNESEYSVDIFELTPIKVTGRTRISNKSAKSLPSDERRLDLLVKKGETEVHSRRLLIGKQFGFSSDSDQWLNLGEEYEVSIIGDSVLNANSAKFIYEGHNDISISLTATLDDVPPVLSQNGVQLNTIDLVAGDELSGTIKAQDDGVGLADRVDIKLKSSDGQKSFNLPSDGIAFQSPATYQFSYKLLKDQTGKWDISEITLHDKAGNSSIIQGNQIKISVTVFADSFELGRYYFDSGNYADALSRFSKISPQNDDVLYFVFLCQYHQSEIEKALEAFNAISEKSNYLGNTKKKELPQMPRPITSKVWGNLLDNLKENRKNPDYLNLLATVAEELGRNDDARMYRDIAAKQKR